MKVLRLLAEYAPRLSAVLRVDRSPYFTQITALHLAVHQNNTEAAELLVDVFGASRDVVDAEGRRPIDYLRSNAPPELRGLLGAV
jgi:ankyrin repeat protein